MNVLIACEESQAVCKEFRAIGHRAFSCDIQENSGGCPEWHIQSNVLPLLDGHCQFKTEDGKTHEQRECWDMIIAFPPCTHLAVSGARHFGKKYADGRQLEGLWFFAQFLKADCERIAVENPVNIISGKYVGEHFRYQALKYGLPAKPSQIIQPFWFGNKARKATCLWLKGLPKLEPTNIVEPELITYHYANGKIATFSKDFCIGVGSHRGKTRSKTYSGVAKAMAEQWGNLNEPQRKAEKHEEEEFKQETWDLYLSNYLGGVCRDVDHHIVRQPQKI